MKNVSGIFLQRGFHGTVRTTLDLPLLITSHRGQSPLTRNWMQWLQEYIMLCILGGCH